MLTISGIQFDIVWENKKANFEILEKLLTEVSPSTDILILPELFTTGFSMNPEPFAEGMDGLTVEWMQEIASRNNLVICGSIMIKEGKLFHNRFLWVTPEGEIAFYDKRHPFCLAKEADYFTRGHRRKILTHKGWKIFPGICYDLRFPVWNRNNIEYDIMINVANWPEIRSFAWKQFLSARALENQCYVVGINRVGKDVFGVPFSGDSSVISYDGKSVSEAESGKNAVVSAMLSKETLIEYRNKYPFLPDQDKFSIIID